MMNMPHHQAHLVTVINDHLFYLCSLNFNKSFMHFQAAEIEENGEEMKGI